MESRFAFTCCSKWNRGNGRSLTTVALSEGEDSVDCSVFSGHQTKLLLEKVAHLEEDATKRNAYINERNAYINELLGENTDLHRQLAKYENGGV